MIFYTIQGPGYELEIHDDKLKLSKRTWLKGFSKSEPITIWEVKALSGFEISAPRFLLWGKIEWKTYDGSKGTFRFTTNPEMVKKIEKYMQKLILKNLMKGENQIAVAAARPMAA